MEQEADTEWYRGWRVHFERSHDPALPVQAVAEKPGKPTQIALGLDNAQSLQHVEPKIDQIEAQGS